MKKCGNMSPSHYTAGVAVVLVGSCPGGNCPRWQLSGGSCSDGSCPGGCSPNTGPGMR